LQTGTYEKARRISPPGLRFSVRQPINGGCP
jgi:hypothetical protein